MKWQLCAALILVACTAPNPSFVGPTLDGGMTDGNPPGDGSPGDGLGSTDMAAVCSGDQRQCLASTGSASCAGGQFMLDRKCPTSSTCKTGYCQPPAVSTMTAEGHGCAPGPGPQENACLNTGGPGPSADPLSCQPFIGATKAVSWV